jgi:hypothetical protein
MTIVKPQSHAAIPRSEGDWEEEGLFKADNLLWHIQKRPTNTYKRDLPTHTKEIQADNLLFALQTPTAWEYERGVAQLISPMGVLRVSLCLFCMC